MKNYIKLLLLLALSMIANQVMAYTTYDCDSQDVRWSNESQTIYAYTGDFPSGSSWRTALVEAVARLNDNAAGFKFIIVYDWNTPALANGRSEVWIDNISAPGITSLRWNTNSCNLIETDIRMDSSVSWTTSTNKTNHSSYGGSGRSFQTTLLHELGHAMGLGHEADEYNIMGQDRNHLHTNGNTARAYLGEDASDGSVFLYGSSNVQDLGVVHWRRTGASGEYSLHDRTRLLNPSTNAELSFTNINGEKRYNVHRGQSVKVELTFENNGNDHQYEDVGYYVSTNSYITTWDTQIASRNLNLSPDSVYTSSYTVTIPSNLSCSTNYWLGAVIDKNGSLSERLSWNNASYIPIRTNWNYACLFVLQPLDLTSQLLYPR